MRISDWSSDVCSSDLLEAEFDVRRARVRVGHRDAIIMLAILRRHKIFDVDPHLAALADDEVDLLADRMIAHRPLADEHFMAAHRFEHRRLPPRPRNAPPPGLPVLHPTPGFGTPPLPPLPPLHDHGTNH